MITSRLTFRKFSTAVLAAALPLLTVACTTADSGSTASKAEPGQTVTDGSGTDVTLPKSAKNIVCLTAVCDDTLVELGLRPAASTNAGTDGLLGLKEFLGSEEAKKVPSIDGAFGEENLEQVIGAKPDLVIGLEGAHDALREPLQDAAPMYLAKISSVDDSKKFLRMMAAVTGTENRAEKAIATLDDKISTAASQVTEKKTTTLAMYGSDKDFGVDTKDSVLGSVLSRFSNYPWPTPAGQKGGHSAGEGTYSLEEIARKNPAVIFVQTFSFGTSSGPKVSEQLADDPVWSSLTAVKNGNVVEVPTKIWAEGRGTRSLGIVAEQAAKAIAESK